MSAGNENAISVVLLVLMASGVLLIEGGCEKMPAVSDANLRRVPDFNRENRKDQPAESRKNDTSQAVKKVNDNVRLVVKSKEVLMKDRALKDVPTAVIATDGRIELDGTVYDQGAFAEAEQVTSAVPGVKKVENDRGKEKSHDPRAESAHSYLCSGFEANSGMNLVLVTLLLGLSVLSGMLGIGVAFAAVPFLSLYLPDLVNQVQPLSLLLNGVTALFSLIGFARAGHVDWRRGGILALATTLSAPIGAYFVQFVNAVYIWAVYFVSRLSLLAIVTAANSEVG